MRIHLLSAVFALPIIAFSQTATGPIPASGNVALPVDEYNRLVELAAKTPKRPEGPPAPFTLKSAVMKLQAAGEAISGAIELEGEVLAKGETAVPLISEMTVFDAQRQGKDLPIDQAGSFTRAVLPGPGEFSISLRAGLPLKMEAGRAAFNLPAPEAGTVQLTLVIPGDRTNVTLSPGLITSRTSAGGQTTIEATLVPGRSTSIWWAAREAVTPVVPREVRFLSDVKTLASVTEAALNLVALIDITVVQGDPWEFAVELPSGYSLTGVTGPSLDTSDMKAGMLMLKVRNAVQRSHQFLISLEKSLDTPNAAPKTDVPFVTVKATQRETGEVLVEGSGSLELAAKESGALKRMDVKETSPYLRTLAHDSLTAAFRYHRQATDVPGLALEWVRFPESALPTAIAQSATVTTVVTSEGRSLTEVKLVVKNQSQPFLKVGLPAGSTILSADVAGEKVKPAEGADGQRVPLLRPGFRPTAEYTVSFVFLHAGSAFAKKGGSQLLLPKMDIPVGMLEWEVFLPSQYKVADFGGNVIPSWLIKTTPETADEEFTRLSTFATLQTAPLIVTDSMRPDQPGQISGVITDASGALLPNARVTVVHVATGYTRTTQTDPNGRWVVSGLPVGPVRVTADSQGFKRTIQQLNHTGNEQVNLRLDVGSVSESVEVSAAAQSLRSVNDVLADERLRDKKDAFDTAPQPAAAPAAPSANILNLKQKVAGVLPIAIDIPRMGTSYRFVKPLVIDEETTVTFAYRTK